ncbi:hypothetical protein EJB05_25333, partial [Eragrostis curvula]
MHEPRQAAIATLLLPFSLSSSPPRTALCDLPIRPPSPRPVVQGRRSSRSSRRRRLITIRERGHR